MSPPKRIFVLAYVTIALFPVLTAADAVITHRFSAIPYPSLLFILAIFIPVLFNKFNTDCEREWLGVYRNTVWITLPFLLIAMISTFWGMLPEAYWENGVREIIRDFYHWVLLMLSIGIAYTTTIRKHLRPIIIIAILGSSLSMVIDMISPGTFSDLEHRTSGFYGNSNDGAMSILYLSIAAINWKNHDFISLFILVIVGLSVFTTQSVQGLILFMIILVTYVVLNLGGRGRILRKIVFVTIAPILVFFLVKPLLIEMLETSEIFENVASKERIEAIINLAKGDFTFAEEHDRLYLVHEYWQIILQAPIVGRGTGYIASTIRGPHNIYIKFWVENGILGLLAYLALVFCTARHFLLLKDFRGMLFSFAFFYSGFFDQNLLHNRTFIVLLGIFGAFAFLDHSRNSSTTEPYMRSTA